MLVASSTVSAQLLPFSKKLLFVRHGIRYLLLLLLLSGCFKFDTTAKMTQDAAVQYCQGVENATLIEIHNQEQKDFFVMERDVIEAEGGRKTCFFSSSLKKNKKNKQRWSENMVARRNRPGEGGRLDLDEVSSTGRGLCLVANATQRRAE